MKKSITMENQPQSVSEVPCPSCKQDLWFCYSPDFGYEEFATEELAKKAAEDAIDSYRDDAPSDGWSEEVWNVRYGKILGWTIETMRKSRPAADELDEEGNDSDGTYWGEWDEISDYGISSENDNP